MRERKMYYGATPFQFEKARLLRSNPTMAENMLWSRLRNKQILGLRFRRQHPISDFVADFYCHRIKLVIEVDGENHDWRQQKFNDKIRTRHMRGLNLTIVRFSDADVEENPDEVLETITKLVRELLDNKASDAELQA